MLTAGYSSLDWAFEKTKFFYGRSGGVFLWRCVCLLIFVSQLAWCQGNIFEWGVQSVSGKKKKEPQNIMHFIYTLKNIIISQTSIYKQIENWFKMCKKTFFHWFSVKHFLHLSEDVNNFTSLLVADINHGWLQTLKKKHGWNVNYIFYWASKLKTETQILFWIYFRFVTAKVVILTQWKSSL